MVNCLSGYGVKRQLKLDVEPTLLDSGNIILRANQNSDKIRIWKVENEVLTQIIGRDSADSQQWVISGTVNSIQALKSL